MAPVAVRLHECGGLVRHVVQVLGGQVRVVHEGRDNGRVGVLEPFHEAVGGREPCLDRCLGDGDLPGSRLREQGTQVAGLDHARHDEPVPFV